LGAEFEAEECAQLLPPPLLSNGTHAPASRAHIGAEEWVPGSGLPEPPATPVGDVRRACDDGMAMQLEDALSRGCGSASSTSGLLWRQAPEAARMMASRLGWSDTTPHLERYRAHLAGEFASPVAETVAEA